MTAPERTGNQGGPGSRGPSGTAMLHPLLRALLQVTLLADALAGDVSNSSEVPVVLNSTLAPLNYSSPTPSDAPINGETLKPSPAGFGEGWGARGD